MPRHGAGPRLYLKAAEAATATGGSRLSIWIIRDGSQRKSTGCHQHERAEAEQALADYIAAKYRPPTGIGQSLLVEEALAAYLKDNENSPSFKDMLVPTVAPLAVWWKGKTLREVVKRNCDAYVKWRTSQFKKRHPNSKAKPERVSIATARHDLKSLRAAINSYRANHDPELVVPKVSLPPAPPSRTDYWLTRKAVATLLREAMHPERRHLARFILIGVYTGSRSGDIFGLRWLPSPTDGWINLESETLHRKGSGVAASNKRAPPARIHHRLLPHLRRWHRMDMEQGITHVVHYEGQPITKLRRSWATARRLAGEMEGKAPHILRHTAATWLMQAGVNHSEASGYLGMSPKTLWEVYGHHHPDFQKAAASASGKATRR